MSLLVFSSFSSFSSSSASSCESIPSRIAPQSRRAAGHRLGKVAARPSSAAASSSDGNTTRRRMATIGKVESRGSLACPTRLTPQYTSQSTATSCSARSATGSAASSSAARRAGTAGRENHSSRKMRVTKPWIPMSSSRMRNARNRNASTPCLKSTLELRMQSCRMCITRLRTLTPTSEMRSTMARSTPRDARVARHVLPEQVDHRRAYHRAVVRHPALHGGAHCSHSRTRGSASTTADSARTAAARTVMAGSSSAPSRRSTRMCSWRASPAACCSARNRRMAQPAGQKRAEDAGTRGGVLADGVHLAPQNARQGPVRFAVAARAGPARPEPHPAALGFARELRERKGEAEPSRPPSGPPLRASTWRTCLMSMASRTSASVRPDSATCVSAASATTSRPPRPAAPSRTPTASPGPSPHPPRPPRHRRTDPSTSSPSRTPPCPP